MPKVFETFQGGKLEPLNDRMVLPRGGPARIPPRKWQAISNRGVGVEIEVEGIVRELTVPGWRVKPDNSLRNAGAELVTKYGCRIGHVLGLLEEAERVLKKGAHNFSARTSVHVHLDVRYFPVQQLEAVLILYTVFEDALFRFAGKDRTSSIYCVPLRSSNLMNNPDRITYEIERWQKYCAMNLLTIPEFGTIEFRHMDGTCDSSRIYDWILMLGLLLQYARDCRLDVLRERINDIKSTSQYEIFAEEIFYGLVNKLVILPDEIDGALSDAKLFFNTCREFK